MFLFLINPGTANISLQIKTIISRGNEFSNFSQFDLAVKMFISQNEKMSTVYFRSKPDMPYLIKKISINRRNEYISIAYFFLADIFFQLNQGNYEKEKPK